MLDRVRVAGTMSCCLLVAGCTRDASSEAPAATRAKSVILITIDTLRADHLGCYGYARDTSPQIDALARDGVRFDQPVVQWPKTTPSIASMLTGLYPHSTGIERACALILDERFETLAERFRAAGYATVAAVTNPVLGREFGFAQGFENFNQAWRIQTATVADDVHGPEGGSRTATRRALDGVDQAPADRPLFLWVHYMDPHSPYAPPAEYRDRFVDDAHYDGASTVPFLEASQEASPMDNGKDGIPPHVRLGDERRPAQYVALYDAEIYANDEQVGELLAGLERRGILSDALVVLTADHGEHLGEHDTYFVHGPRAYDECARVPLILRGSGLPRGMVVGASVPLVGLHATLLEWAGITPGNSVEGESLLPVIHGDQEAPRFVFSAAGYRKDFQRSVRWGPWKLIHVRDPIDRAQMAGAEFELYDLKADPGETRNVYAENERVAMLLERHLADWAAAGEAANVAPALGRAPELEESRDALRELGYVR